MITTLKAMYLLTQLLGWAIKLTFFGFVLYAIGCVLYYGLFHHGLAGTVRPDLFHGWH